ncbi:hypothetical protein D3C87_964440 [compost metagenome]
MQGDLLSGDAHDLVGFEEVRVDERHARHVRHAGQGIGREVLLLGQAAVEFGVQEVPGDVLAHGLDEEAVDLGRRGVGIANFAKGLNRGQPRRIGNLKGQVGPSFL